MKINSLGLKISLLTTLMIAVIIGTIIWLVNLRSDIMLSELSVREAKAANIALAKTLQECQEDALIRAVMIAESPDVIHALLENDGDELKKALVNLLPGLDSISLYNIAGNVVKRAHNEKEGENTLDKKAMAAALSTGKGISTIERGQPKGLYIRGSAAIRDYDGRVIGAVVCGNDLSLPKYVEQIKERSNCEVTIFDGDERMNTTLINEQGERAIGTKAGAAVIEKVIAQRADYMMRLTLFGGEYDTYYSPLIVEDEVMGMLFTGVNIDAALAIRAHMINSVLTIAITAGVICIVLMLLFSIFSVSRPLKKIGAFAEKIASGDIGISSSASTISVRSSDEVGALARALERAYEQLRGYVGEISERMNGLAEGDLLTESDYHFQGDFILIKDSINSIARNLNRIMAEVGNSAAQVTVGSKQVADGAQTLAQGSSEQASAIEQLSASISEIKEKTGQNAEVARNAADLSIQIKDNAEKGSLQMEQMMEAVEEINRASGQISKVIKVIDDIAFQTNILALNAAVEAARAGQHGKGFAVVAEEVRNLASKSASAAKDTGGLIENSIEKANLGLNIANETSASLQKIVDGIKRSTEIVTQIAQSSDEQALAINQINIGVDQVAQIVQQNSATAEQSAAASEEMSSQSDLLQELISQFKINGGNEASHSLSLASPKMQLGMPQTNDYGKY